MRAPEHVAFLVEAVGEDAALAFIEAAGGQRLYVPAQGAGSRLAAVYGEGIATALSARFPGEKYEVPIARKWRIALLAARGLTVNEICQRVGLGKSAVYDVLSRPYDDGGGKPARTRWVDERQLPLL